MQKLKITIFLCVAIVFNLQSQTIIEVNQDKKKHPKLENEKTVFYVKKDSIQQDRSQIKSLEEFLFIGKCNIWDGESCGIVSLALFAEKAAKTRGYNAASLNYYRGTSKEDTLSMIFYRLSEEKTEALNEENRTKYLTFINPQNGAETDVSIEEEYTTLYAGTYLQKEVKKNDMAIKLGKGFFNTKSGNISFKKANRRYFLINRYKITGSATSNEKSFAIGVPKLIEVGELTGEILMEFLTKLGTEK
jgi:hypothetical protein